MDLERTAQYLLAYKRDHYDKYKDKVRPVLQLINIKDHEEGEDGKCEKEPKVEEKTEEIKDEEEYVWEIPYVLLLWLSIIVLVPFDLRSLDDEDVEGGFVATLVSACKEFLADCGRIRDAASMVMANLLTR